MRSTIVIMLTIALAACSKLSRSGHDSTGATSSASASARASAPSNVTLLPAQSPSLHDLSLDLVDQNGKPIALHDFASEPVIISMFYSGCPYACPMLISKIQGAERQLDPQVRSRVQVVMVSFDSEHDTPAVLQQVAVQHHVDGTRWHLAHASDADVRTLAAVLGIRYQKLPDGAFSHSSVITVLDARGVARFRDDDLNVPPDGVARAIAMLEPTPRTAIVTR